MFSRITYRLFLVLMSGIVFGMVFFPRLGPADFRYTGSDEGRPVLNLGYPVAVFIHDPITSPGLIHSPLTHFIIAGIALIFLFLITAPELIRLFVRLVTPPPKKA